MDKKKTEKLKFKTKKKEAYEMNRKKQEENMKIILNIFNDRNLDSSS